LAQVAIVPGPESSLSSNIGMAPALLQVSAALLLGTGAVAQFTYVPPVLPGTCSATYSTAYNVAEACMDDHFNSNSYGVSTPNQFEDYKNGICTCSANFDSSTDACKADPSVSGQIKGSSVKYAGICTGLQYANWWMSHWWLWALVCVCFCGCLCYLCPCLLCPCCCCCARGKSRGGNLFGDEDDDEEDDEEDPDE